MNAADDKIIETLRQHKYLSAKELLTILSLHDIGFCDRDVCCRLRFPQRVRLGTIYYLKANEKRVLATYIRDHWVRIRAMAFDGELSGDDFPRGFLAALRHRLEQDINFLESDIDSLQEELAEAEAKCEDYEAVLHSL